MTGRLSAVPDLPPDDGSDGPDRSDGFDGAGRPGAGAGVGAAPGPGGPGRRPASAADADPADPSEAATFRVRCPDCGPQIIPISAVRFVQTRTGDDPSANRYVFTCPQCRSKVRRPAGPELAEILRASGVATLALHQGSGEPV